MNEVTASIDDSIKTKIYTIRGMHVMLDRDLAELYDVKPIRLREQVKRNSDRFPDDFMFQLNDKRLRLWYRKMRHLINMVEEDDEPVTNCDQLNSVINKP